VFRFFVFPIIDFCSDFSNPNSVWIKSKYLLKKKLKSNVDQIFAFLIIRLFSMDKAKVPVEKKIYSNVDQIFAFLISFLIIRLFSMDKAKVPVEKKIKLEKQVKNWIILLM
jgi:hypothetical protein